MILRVFSTLLLWGIVIGGVVRFREDGAMWILTVAAVVTQFEIYTLLGRLGFAANRISGLLTGAFLIPMGYFIVGAGMDTLAVGALLMSAASVLFPQAQRGMYVKRLLPTFFGLLYVPVISRPGQDPGYEDNMGRGRLNDACRLLCGESKVGRVDPFLPQQTFEALRERLTVAESTAYLCGNPGMISDVKDLLAGKGFNAEGRESQLITEDYW